MPAPAEPESAMSKKPAPTNGLLHPEADLYPDLHPDLNPGLAAGSVLLLAFFLRLWKASGTFLNMDEAMHSMAANTNSLA